MGAHMMLVVGGIKPGFNDLQPLDASGCDASKFSQGLGMLSLNNHTWTTAYDPVVGAAPYTVHPDIVKVIGGDANGGATLQSPAAGFSQASLGTLLRARMESNITGAVDSPGKTPDPQGLSAGVKGGIAVGVIAVVGLLMGALALLYLRRRRKQRKHRPQISTPILHGLPPQMKYYRELHSISHPVELRGNTRDETYANNIAASELMGKDVVIAKPPPIQTSEEKAEVTIHELEDCSPVSQSSHVMDKVTTLPHH